VILLEVAQPAVGRIATLEQLQPLAGASRQGLLGGAAVG
jgi:hypothetical protein